MQKYNFLINKNEEDDLRKLLPYLKDLPLDLKVTK